VSENEEAPKSTLAADLRLRPEQPPVTRLSRKVLMGLAAVAAILISGALIWGLYQGQKKPAGGTEVYNTENRPTPDGLTALPRDYTGVTRSNLLPIAPGVPVLGPPLPGDLGRPIHNAQVTAPGSGDPAVDAEQQRVVQETEAAPAPSWAHVTYIGVGNPDESPAYDNFHGIVRLGCGTLIPCFSVINSISP
jgi:type IV secretory pathway VirB10-like protein